MHTFFQEHINYKMSIKFFNTFFFTTAIPILNIPSTIMSILSDIKQHPYKLMQAHSLYSQSGKLLTPTLKNTLASSNLIVIKSSHFKRKRQLKAALEFSLTNWNKVKLLKPPWQNFNNEVHIMYLCCKLYLFCGFKFLNNCLKWCKHHP